MGTLKRPTIFIVWPNGSKFLDDILDILDSEENLEIIRVIKKEDYNMKKLVRDVYKNDQVNALHITGKVKYLKKISGPVTFILCDETAPQIVIKGEKNNIINSASVLKLKNDIRLRFNTRLPNGEISHNHVVHSTDSEDEALRLLHMVEPTFMQNYKISTLGVWGLDGCSMQQGLEVIQETVKCQNVNIDFLKAVIIENHGRKAEYIPLEDTPHFKFLHGNRQPYLHYISQHRGLGHKVYYSGKKFEKLLNVALLGFETLPPVIVKNWEDQYIIVDGLHRAVIAKRLGLSNINCWIRDE